MAAILDLIWIGSLSATNLQLNMSKTDKLKPFKNSSSGHLGFLILDSVCEKVYSQVHFYQLCQKWLN